MAEWRFLCRGLFASTFQANMAYGSFHCTEDSIAYRVRLPVRQLGFHVFLASELQIFLSHQEMKSDTSRQTST